MNDKKINVLLHDDRLGGFVEVSSSTAEYAQQAQLREEEAKRLADHTAWEARQAEEEEVAKVHNHTSAHKALTLRVKY